MMEVGLCVCIFLEDPRTAQLVFCIYHIQDKYSLVRDLDPSTEDRSVRFEQAADHPEGKCNDAILQLLYETD
jgi:hypothetical protein